MANSALAVLITVITVAIQRTSQQRDSFECGVQKVKINEVILNGHDAKPGEWPWHAAIYHLEGSTKKYACGGTLISPRFVLTAAHCVRGYNEYVLSSRRVQVMLGVYNLNIPNSKSLQVHGVQQIHQFKDNPSLRNDIALIELGTEAEFNNFVQPACVTEDQDLTGRLGTVVGWGHTELEQTSPVLKVVQLPVISAEKCLERDRDVFGNTLDRSLFCAGYTNGTGVCNGDSGGGLVFKKGNVWSIGGIVSYTAPRESNSNLCRTNGFAGFTSVYYFHLWIRETTNLPLGQGCKWMKWKLNGGNPPGGVLVGDGNESPVYVGRTEFGGDKTIGQFVTASRQMLFVWGDVARRATDFEVLIGRGFYWVTDYDGNVPVNAVVGGKTAGGDNLYIGRHKYNGVWNSGVIVPFLNGLYIGVGRQFQKFSDYEVLVHDDPSCQK